MKQANGRGEGKAVALLSGPAGAVAIGALTVAVLAVRRLAIRRLAVSRATVRRVEIDELVVKRFRVEGTEMQMVLLPPPRTMSLPS